MTRKSKKYLILALSFIMISLTFVLGQNSGAIKVTVNFFLPSGQTQPLPGATVKLLDKSKKVIREEVTDDKGQVIFEGLAPGEYTIHGEMEGFKT